MKYQKKVLLMGGMGNKFFQLARAIEFKEKNITVELVYIDLKMKKLYKLSGHTIHPDWINISSLASKFNIPSRAITIFEFFQLGIKFFIKKLFVSNDFNSNLSDALDTSGLTKKTWDIGYFQSTNHISMSSINKVADLLGELLCIEKKNSNNLTLHIRGGDFDLTNRIQENQIKDIVFLCNSLMLNLVVITNDKDYSKKILRKTTYKFYLGESACFDFIELASSTNLYLSNSTFAFWAAMTAIRSHDANIHLPNNWFYSDLIGKKKR